MGEKLSLDYLGKKDSVLIRLVEDNSLDGLLVYGKDQDGLVYDCDKLRKLREKKIIYSKKNLNELILSVIEILENAFDYYIFQEDILLSLDYIYYDANGIYLLLYPGQSNFTLKSLLVEMIGSFSFQEDEDWSYLIKMINYLSDDQYNLIDSYLLLND